MADPDKASEIIDVTDRLPRKRVAVLDSEMAYVNVGGRGTLVHSVWRSLQATAVIDASLSLG